MLPPIRGLIESSLLEWDGKVSTVVCLQGCNLRCPYCHSHNLISREMPSEVVPLEGILGLLEDRRGWIDGVVVSGGEPAIHPELPEFLAAFKSLGCAVKLDTNGTFPGMLSDLIDMGLVDYVAMDLKAPLEPARYAAAAGVEVDVNAVGRSIEVLRRGRVDYEFRTTVCPTVLSLEDLETMARSIAGARRYVLQQFIPETALRRELRTVKPYAQCDLLAASQKLSGLVRHCQLRGQPSPEPAAAGVGG
ncbi:MAG TPA: anaerobic ribonucleoside-triphosphate reductase activating protein [Planctomycetota bacterium]|nr:anaerobic ribonucleoside-triphosphate reductase activating protein [Planctomycetota bacterium]